MARTVDSSFVEYMNSVVNINPAERKRAIKSRDNLLDNIAGFSGDLDFFNLYEEKTIQFGSFARKTKTRPLDDIDMMICLSADGNRTYTEDYEKYVIWSNEVDEENDLVAEGTKRLNSTKVMNRLISKLSKLEDYEKAEIHKNKEAITLKMKSYTWNFDIVPCFFAADDFYLIPDGKGNWKRTDPRIDNARTRIINNKHDGMVLPLIRLIKKWNNRNVTIRIPSYLLETMILNRYEELDAVDDWYIDVQFMFTMGYIAEKIRGRVNDPKGIQGDLNPFKYEERYSISRTIFSVYEKAHEAIFLETHGNNQSDAIKKWVEVFGSDFPAFGD